MRLGGAALGVALTHLDHRSETLRQKQARMVVGAARAAFGAGGTDGGGDEPADGTSERHEPESDDGSRLCWMAMAPSGHSTAPPSSLAAVSLIDSSLVLIGGFNRVADADLAQLHLCRLAGSAPGDQLAHGS